MKNKVFVFLLLFVGIFFIGANHISTEASTIKAGIVNTDGARLNVRTTASTVSSIKAKLSDKSYVTIHDIEGNFYYVKFDKNNYGFVHKNYIDIVSSNAKIVDTNWAKLNVRYGPGTNYYAFDQISHNDKVVVLRTNGNWSNILYDGNEVGYVHSSYLTSSSSSVAYPKISLSLENFKQFDSRWANVELGTSGGTIKQIGCLTTALAMTESYRKGYIITPKNIANTVSYTSGGSLYWPTNYVQTTNSSNYLQKIYDLLRSGKPVLIGAKNNQGGQHWVVVTGYKGGNTLSKSNFTINDPGSSYRDTLDEFFNVYPNFYKIAYYK